MSDPYASLIADARSFFAALSRNNNRDWWQEHKDGYDTKLKVPALALLDEMCAPLAEITGEAITPKLFRPHRDVRFSKDKTPYNTHLHMMWSVAGGGRQDPVFFFGIAPDYVTVGAGTMGFDKPVLEDWRKFVDLDGARVAGIIAGVAAHGYAPRAPDLKRVPPAFAADHPQGELLKYKGFVMSGDMPRKGAVHSDLRAAFTQLWPLNDLLLSIAAA